MASAISKAILKAIENLPECNDSRFNIHEQQLLPQSQPWTDLPVRLSPPLQQKQKSEGDVFAIRPIPERK